MAGQVVIGLPRAMVGACGGGGIDEGAAFGRSLRRSLSSFHRARLVDRAAARPQAAQQAEGSVQTQGAGVDASVNVPLESEAGVSYVVLRDRLAAGDWELADEETRRLICVLAGEGAVQRKWVYFSEVQFIPATDLLTIDSLWRAYSSNRFGYSVQRRMWLAAQQRWKPFFLQIGWTYGENSTYKKFPMEFTWSLEAPVGHLPLTNALRGTQLFEKLLKHPAFSVFDEQSAMPEPGALPTFTQERLAGKMLS